MAETSGQLDILNGSLTKQRTDPARCLLICELSEVCKMACVFTYRLVEGRRELASVHDTEEVIFPNSNLPVSGEAIYRPLKGWISKRLSKEAEMLTETRPEVYQPRHWSYPALAIHFH